jgi:hypothetical protein
MRRKPGDFAKGDPLADLRISSDLWEPHLLWWPLKQVSVLPT